MSDQYQWLPDGWRDMTCPECGGTVCCEVGYHSGHDGLLTGRVECDFCDAAATFTVEDTDPQRSLLVDASAMSGEKGVDKVYRDRNLLAVALAKFGQDPPLSGWKPDPESPKEWAIVVVETPAGQVSWHVPRTLAEKHLRRGDFDYDGYGRDEKNERLMNWVSQGFR